MPKNKKAGFNKLEDSLAKMIDDIDEDNVDRIAEFLDKNVGKINFDAQDDKDDGNTLLHKAVLATGGP